MKAIVIGNGISGLTAAYRLANNNCEVILVAPEIPERSQSVMAAGGINAGIDTMGEGDSVALHIEETLKSGMNTEPREMVEALCNGAPETVRELAEMGVMFNRDSEGELLCRSFGGQSKKRTAFAGTSTGKQIVTALVSRIREAQADGRITSLFGRRFLMAAIEDGVCRGAHFLNEASGEVETLLADAVIVATGGQNKLFGKTTGSTLCDGFAAAKLFTQGVTLRNLEFIQYHPTTLEASAKRMLISEAARGEGGRLFYNNPDGTRCCFMEEKYGEKGNLMPRDVVSREMFLTKRNIYLDVSFLDAKFIKERLAEIYDLCRDYAGIDITKEPIPVAPSVHFFMGGIAVDINHKTNIERLYAIGECASAYHGANRLGGNSLLAAVHSGKTAASAVLKLSPSETACDFVSERLALAAELAAENRSGRSAVCVMGEIAKLMREHMGIIRDEASLKEGISVLETLIAEPLGYDGTLSCYESYTLPYLLELARASMLSALSRKESRGAHTRADYPELSDAFCRPTFAFYNGGKITVGGDAK